VVINKIAYLSTILAEMFDFTCIKHRLHYICHMFNMLERAIKIKKMNKTELIDAIASESKLSKVDAKKALDAFTKVTTKALKKGDKLALVGFGSFSVTKRSAREGRNPQTGKTIKIAAKNVVKFKAGADLSGSVNK
jgi:DNA-binding protein HU-beta